MSSRCSEFCCELGCHQVDSVFLSLVAVLLLFVVDMGLALFGKVGVRQDGCVYPVVYEVVQVRWLPGIVSMGFDSVQAAFYPFVLTIIEAGY